ncbi:histidine kinase [Halomicrococcus gelatinilyticus]|uniref:histidine kinase n=1 Tax=Halomicrococcus gelatinilyticus TaxID=1702103 RepID=UPI002E143945
MATETQTRLGRFRAGRNGWIAGAAGGLVGSVLFGLMMPTATIAMAIPAMYGIEGPASTAGWLLHVFHGVALGLAYVALVQVGPLADVATRLRGAVGLGVAYGVVTTALLPVLVMPVWLAAVGFPMAPPFPNLAVPGTLVSLVGHVVYAVPVALAYALAARNARPDRSKSGQAA